MAQVKVVFFSWDTFYGKLIRFHTKSKWTHVGVIIDEDLVEGTYTIAEALNKGLTISKYGIKGLEQNMHEGRVTIKTVTTRASPAEFKRICEKYEGAPYDWVSILNIGLYSILGRLALNFKGPKSVICSEFVARVLYEASNGKVNFEEEYGKAFDLITPAEIFKSKFLD